LTKFERPDIEDFYAFWEIKPQYKEDRYYLLAHTMGLLPTDNFELLADYRPIKDLSFLTDLAGLSTLKLSPGTVKVGDQLSFKKEPNNSKDKYAVKVYKNDIAIGYIKKIHSKIFHCKKGCKAKLIVKAVDQNGTVKRIFVKVCF
ncbi:MAG: HIRAN domain-containing protein, partial [Bacteroidia bacterium]|nr:HIRAN domain-containing protein [Bacteroidia bacterium]